MATKSPKQRRGKRGPKPTPAVITRGEVERAIWRLTQWRGAASHVDRLLTVIDEYALAHGALIPDYPKRTQVISRVMEKAPQSALIVDNIAAADKELRCNSCGEFYPIAQMAPHAGRPDNVRTCCRQCVAHDLPSQSRFGRQRVYRIFTDDGWAVSRRKHPF